MLKSHHKSYYTYFNQRPRSDPRRLSPKSMTLYTAMRKLSNKRCSVREFHFLFNIIKNALGIGLNTLYEDPLVTYGRFVEKTHPSIFDNFHADLRHLMTLEDNVHPWRLKNRMIADKLRTKIKNRLLRVWKTHTTNPKSLNADQN